MPTPAPAPAASASDEILRQGEARLRLLTERTPTIIWSTDTELRLTSSLGGALNGVELKPGEAVGRTLAQYFGTNDPDFLPIAAHRRALRGQTTSFEIEWKGRTFQCHVEPFRDAGGGLVGTVGVALDITERRRAEEKLLHAALHDPLTGLPNRALFLDRLTHALVRTQRREGLPFAVLLLDLDRFKTVNDSLGHMAGDRLLVEVARRLEGSIRPGDTVARFGGDEFAVLLEAIEDPSGAVRIADRIQYDLSPPVDVGGQEVITSGSIGIAISHHNYRAPDEILRDADIAMYRAKDAGRGRCQVFDQAMHAQAVARLGVEMALRRALDRGELRLHYQPIMEIATGAITSFEALVRWDYPQRGLVLPADFIPLAEETGLIVPLGRWVLIETCREARQWGNGGAPGVSVNVSRRQLATPDFSEDVQRILGEAQLNPKRLELEVSEASLIDDLGPARTTLSRLKTLDIHLGIDDFGTGHSSLSRLDRLPVDTLKIDQSFIANMCRRRRNLEIVRTIVRLGHGLGMTVVAEGVETSEQFAHLRAMGCDRAQGYLLSHPVEASTARALAGHA